MPTQKRWKNWERYRRLGIGGKGLSWSKNRIGRVKKKRKGCQLRIKEELRDQAYWGGVLGS